MSKQTLYRCAVYTRKSHEEGLDQDFNSLDAQSEACKAYVTSQAGLGWTLRDKPYDDGGISGGHMERPALQALIADIKAGLIDVVVVYKVDRLTRSLMDLSKLVDVFDSHDVSFVSVTQAFNTTTSMGRLSLIFNKEELSRRLGITLSIADTIVLTQPMTLRRRGQEMKIVIGGEEPKIPDKDVALIKMIAQAHLLKTELEAGIVTSIKDFAIKYDLDHGDAKNLIPYVLLPQVLLKTF